LLHQAFEFKFCDHDLGSVGCVESQHRSFIRSSLGLNTSLAGAGAAGSRQIKLADAKTKLPGALWPAVGLQRMNEKRS
jgi:hypothetical protein